MHSLPQSRPLADPAPSEREPWVRAFIFSTILSLQAYKINLPLSGEVPRRGGGGTEVAFGTMSNNHVFASSTSSVSLSLDSSPYKGKPCGVHTFIISREAISLPQTLPSARYCREASGMIRRCIHSLSLDLWPIQLPRRGSLGYSYLYGHTQNRRTQFAPTARGLPFCL